MPFGVRGEQVVTGPLLNVGGWARLWRTVRDEGFGGRLGHVAPHTSMGERREAYLFSSSYASPFNPMFDLPIPTACLVATIHLRSLHVRIAIEIALYVCFMFDCVCKISQKQSSYF